MREPLSFMGMFSDETQFFAQKQVTGYNTSAGRIVWNHSKVRPTDNDHKPIRQSLVMG